MTIRIDRIERREYDGHYSWHLDMKGLYGQGIYCKLATGVGGHGLSYAPSEVPWTELLPPERFYAHPGLDAEQVAHRVAACLVCVGWGDEFYDDRDSITNGYPIATKVVKTLAQFDPLEM